jgi:hypothetical protein
MKCFPEIPYAPPPGYCDYPYYQTYDVLNSGLANGASPRSVDIPSDGYSQFILRAILGMPDILQANGSVQVYDAKIKPMAHSELKLAGCGIYMMVPERLYPLASDITFDLSLVNVSGQPYGKLLFLGVKRIPENFSNPKPSIYNYAELPYSWLLGTAIPGVGTAPFIIIPVAGGAPQMYNFPILNYDFELLEIRAVNAVTGVPCSGVFAARIWDPDFPPRVLMDSPILDRYLINNADGATNADLVANVTTRIPVTFPTPSMLYPRQSILQIEITSLAPVPTIVQIELRGIQRIPR